jgi:phosphohistidine phosphatase
LTERGDSDATALGQYLAHAGIVPDFAEVSSSARTLQTFERIVAALARDVPFALDRGLYNATAGDIRDRLRGVRTDVRTLMIVGHNPGVMEAALTLIRDGDPAEIARLRGRFPPCSLALLTFDTDAWADARASGGRLDLFLMPEDFNAIR